MESTPRSTETDRLSPAVKFVGIASSVVAVGVVALTFATELMGPSAAHKQTISMNNLKQIGLALHMYHQEHRSFPPAYIADENGRPMHSWRVLILPYMGQQALYDQYRFDEPWDGPNNRQLHDLRPTMYADPNCQGEVKSHTNYAVITGDGTMFPGATPLKTTKIRDGISTVLAVVSVGDSDIVWCEPRDLQFDAMSFRINDPDVPGIKNGARNEVAVLFGDTRIDTLDSTTSEQQLKSMILRNDRR